MKPKYTSVLLLCVVVLTVSCKRRDPESGFLAIRADHQVIGNSEYPLAIDPNRVGTYPPDTKSGSGYFYDDVLEYRVWLHPEKGAKPLNGTHDYFVAFAQYEQAQKFSEHSPGAEPPLVLVRQIQWIDEPQRGHFIPKQGERITEWQIAWLKSSKRTDRSIVEFLKHPEEANP